MIAELSYKISRLNINNNLVRLTWCLAHVGIKNNEIVDRLAKEASTRSTLCNNKLTLKETIASFKTEYHI